MARLTQLIEHYCPDGVEYVKLGDVFDLGSGYTPSRKNTQYWENGSIPWFRMEDIRTNGRILSYSLEKITPEAVKGGRLFPRNSVMISTSATIGEHAIVTTDFMCNQRFHVLVLRESFAERVHPRFVYYVGFSLGEYCREHVNEGNFKTVSSAAFKEFPFPLPPREVQDAIVERLDAFAALIENLDSEIALREKRFVYSREQIFSTLDHVEPLGSHGTFLRGRGIQKKDFQDTGKPAFHYGQVHTRYGLSSSTTAALVSDEVFNRSAHASPGDLIIATTSEDDDAVGKAVVWLGQEQAAVGGDAHFFDHSYDPRFIGYFFTTHSFHDQKIPYLTGAKVRRINAESLASIQAPWPPREVQQDIAEKLDTMQALIDNLKQERELRKAQFEYYREKLLTFNS